MKNAVRFEVLHGIERRYGPSEGTARASLELRRAAVLSFEQIVAGAGLLGRVAGPAPVVAAEPARVEAVRQIPAAELARDPRAHPVAPARPPGAARPAYVVVPQLPMQEKVRPAEVETATVRTRSQEVIEAMRRELEEEASEPESGPHPGRATPGGAEVAERSRLSPSQRAAGNRPLSRPGRDGRPAFVTYTVDTAGEG